MKVLANLRIGTRLSGGFALIIGLLLLVSGIGYVGIDEVDDDTEVILHDRYVKVALAQQIESEVHKQLGALRTALLAPEPALTKAELKKLEQSAPAVAQALEKLKASVHSEVGKAALNQLLQSRGAFKEREERLVRLIDAGKADEARTQLFAEILPLQAAYLEAIEKFRATQAAAMEAYGRHARAEARTVHRILLALSAVALLIAIVTAVSLTRSITRPIAAAVRVARTVASGDLTSHIEVTSTDETGELLAALKTMNESLVHIVDQVRQSSDSIATGSNQIAAGSSDLSRRTEEQASSLQQTAASMEEITATVKNSADAARSATDLAGSASAVASKGGAVVGQLVETMAGISASSNRISEITGVIDGIAFQTNILALNAAVEAARAGEQGRGFAVVAGEVRQLAQRAATAAKEIKSLITESVQRVEAGSALVGNAGETMQDVVSHVQRVAQLIAEIGTASEHQSLGIGQVGDAVSQLDQVTQQNAALVEESAAAAESLSVQASRLTAVVGSFRLQAG